LRGLVGAEALLLALALAPVYVATTAGGQALFHPDRDRVYRAAAYGVIALAILSGLPLFD
jgi:hypothetical protein